MTLQSFQMLWEGNYVSNGGRREKTQVAFIIGPKKQKSYFYQVFNIFKIYFLITDIALEFSYTFTMPTPLHSCCWELDKQITQIMWTSAILTFSGHEITFRESFNAEIGTHLLYLRYWERYYHLCWSKQHEVWPWAWQITAAFERRCTGNFTCSPIF